MSVELIAGTKPSQSAQEDRELLQIKQDELEQQMTNTKEVEERFHRETQLIRDR